MVEMLGNTCPNGGVEFCGGNGVTGWICSPQYSKQILDWVFHHFLLCCSINHLALAISLLQLLKDTVFPPYVV